MRLIFALIKKKLIPGSKTYQETAYTIKKIKKNKKVQKVQNQPKEKSDKNLN